MNAAPITIVLSDIVGLPPPLPPAAPSAPEFADLLVSAKRSLASFALLPATPDDALGGPVNSVSPALKKDLRGDDAALPITLPAPVQSSVAAASNDASNASQPPAASGTADNPPAKSAPPTTAATTGSAGSGGAAQTTGGMALPPIAAELNARIALGAQALLSQPSQALATLPHGALLAASMPAPTAGAGAAAHGAAALDPALLLPKLTSASLGAASPSAAPAPLETVLPPGLAQIPASSSAVATSGDAALVANTADASPATTDPGLGTTPAPTSMPLPATDAPALESAAMPMVAASALDQVAASLSRGGKLGLSQIEIQLKPASLGAVDVKIELTHDGRIAAVISADRSDTLLQLERGSGELHQALRDAGLQTDTGSLSFSLRGDPQSGDHGARQTGSTPVAASANADDLPAAPAAIAGTHAPSHSGLLNIQV
jgi:flagellar hook-length control protein FliK